MGIVVEIRMERNAILSKIGMLGPESTVARMQSPVRGYERK
jgi:hypothetical protein